MTKLWHRRIWQAIFVLTSGLWLAMTWRAASFPYPRAGILLSLASIGVGQGPWSAEIAPMARISSHAATLFCATQLSWIRREEKVEGEKVKVVGDAWLVDQALTYKRILDQAFSSEKAFQEAVAVYNNMQQYSNYDDDVPYDDEVDDGWEGATKGGKGEEEGEKGEEKGKNEWIPYAIPARA